MKINFQTVELHKQILKWGGGTVIQEAMLTQISIKKSLKNDNSHHHTWRKQTSNVTPSIRKVSVIQARQIKSELIKIDFNQI